MNTYVRITIAGTLIGWGIGMAINVFKDIKSEAAMKASLSKFERPIGNDKAMISEVPDDESL